MTKQEEYQSWIDNYRANNITLGRCLVATAAMQKVFPELNIIKGHVYCIWGKRGHAWCQTPNGNIVDPTADQFDFIFKYESWKPGDEVYTGKCPDCGAEIWVAVHTLEEEPNKPNNGFCSQECAIRFAKSLER